MQLDAHKAAYLADRTHDEVVDTSLADFWTANLAQLHAETRVFGYGDDWPGPVRVDAPDGM